MSKIEQAISELQREDRRTLYLNKKRVKESYDFIGAPDQLTIIKQFTKGGEAGIPSWLKIQIQKLRGDQALKQISDSPLLMAIMVETHFKITSQLLTLPDEPFRPDAPLIRYIGESHIADKDVTDETTGLSPSLADVVKAEWDEQQNTSYVDDPKEAKAFVWTAAGKPNLAAIASWSVVTENKDNNAWKRHFHRENPKGILGKFEREQDGIVFISPLWLWQTRYIK